MIIVANTKHVNGYEQVGAFGAWVQGRGGGGGGGTVVGPGLGCEALYGTTGALVCYQIGRVS